MWRLNLYGFKLCVCEYVIRIKCGSGCGGGSRKKKLGGGGGLNYTVYSTYSHVGTFSLSFMMKKL